MTTTQDETLAFADAVSGAAAEHWADATSAPSGDLSALWRVGADLGWFELGSAEALSAVVAATRRPGQRRYCGAASGRLGDRPARPRCPGVVPGGAGGSDDHCGRVAGRRGRGR